MSVSASVSATVAMTLTVVETLGTNNVDATASNSTITHNGFNVSTSLSGTSSPAITKTASFSQQLTAGAATIDFTTLTGTNGASVTGNGLRIIAIILTAASGNAGNTITAVTGASNGLPIFGANGREVINKGATVMKYDPSGLGTAIDSTHKTVDLTGTGTDTLNVIVVMG